MDTLTKKQRSYCMSRIRSKWTDPEKKIHNLLKGLKIKHIMHPKISGSPDILLKESKTAIFVHGCFWHKCPKCFIAPKSNKLYWAPKLEKNVLRDKNSEKELKKSGYNVFIIWNHDLKNDKALTKFINKLRY